jgi:DNA-binding response OmpR family regulator
MRKVLIVEDSADIAELLSVRLGMAGYMPLIANDGETALKVLRVEAMDAILLDIGLPGRDGFFVLQNVKSTPALRDIPVIMLTARQAAGDIKLAISLGACDYIAKPFDHENLVFRIERALGKKVAKPQPKDRTRDWFAK